MRTAPCSVSLLDFLTLFGLLLYAVTGHTCAELIVGRADPAQPNIALTSWSGSRVRKHDVIVAKNYLGEEEVDTLNRLVSFSWNRQSCA